MGLASPFTLRAKRLVQQLWALKYDWGKPLNASELALWEAWLDALPDLEAVKMPRCLKVALPQNSNEAGNQLHVFCDASETAFGAVAYSRSSLEREIATVFTMSFTRLPPLKLLSIVRLELQDAVLSVRLANFLKEKVNITRTVFWTGSQVVLQFLGNESRRFHTFVANRIAKIQESSRASHRKHVPSAMNPAHLCYRGSSASHIWKSDLWWQGQ